FCCHPSSTAPDPLSLHDALPISKVPPIRWAWKWWVEAMAKIAKRVAQSREGIDRNKAYPLDEALKILKERSKVKFDETVEVAMKDRKSTRLNSSHVKISYAVFCL